MKKQFLIIWLLLFQFAAIAQGVQFGNGYAEATGNITTQNLVPAGTATANSAVALTLSNHGTATIHVSGTYTGALSLQYSTDNGSTWVTFTNAAQLILETTGVASATIASAAVGGWTTDVAGLTNIRVTGLAAMTGTAVIRVRAVSTAQHVAINAPLPAGSAALGSVSISGSTALTPGTAATNLGKGEDVANASADVGVFMLGVRRDAPVVSTSGTADYGEIATNKWGAVLTAQHTKTAKTFSSSAVYATAATASDIAILPGNATNTVYVTRVVITGIETTAGSVLVLLNKRSTANSGGTSTAPTSTPHDSGDAAAVSTPLFYTANPTPGTLAGTVRAEYVTFGSTTAAAGKVTWEFGDQTKEVLLIGTAQGLAVNLNGATVTGGNVTVYFEWIEI